MFTGIVTDVAQILTIDEHPNGRKMQIGTAFDTKGFELGASIAHNGICLTVTAKHNEEGGQNWFEVFLGHETLSLTTAKKTGKSATRSILNVPCVCKTNWVDTWCLVMSTELQK